MACDPNARRHPLAAADLLADEGRFLEAIDLLTDANRRQRDADIEVRLVALRNAAFAELDREPTASQWADVVTGPREAARPLPELEPQDLSAQLVREQILTYGCAFVRRLVPPRHGEQLVDGIERAFAGHDAHFADENGDGASPWFAPFEPPDGERIDRRRTWVREGGGVWTAESPRVMFDFLETLEELGVRSLIQAYLGERPVLTLNKSTLRRVPVLSGADWHQDGAFLGGGIRTLNLWLCLSRCGEDAPGLDLVPRRLDEIVETGSHGAWFKWSVAPDKVVEAADGVPILRPLFEPGDALLFDELFLHRTATEETMTRERYAIETWFFAPSLYPGDQIPFVW